MMVEGLPPSVARQSRAAFIRGLLVGLHYIPQICHPKIGVAVRSRYQHTQNMCQTARLLHAHFKKSNSPLWPQLCLRLACHDIGHTPYGHAGERVIQEHYDPDFSNSRQSHRYMFSGTEDWPKGLLPFAWYRSAPVKSLEPEQERDLLVLVDFFDNLENAVGDALDLKLLGRPAASDFLAEACSWSNSIRVQDGEPLANYLKRVIIEELAPHDFQHFLSTAAKADTDFVVSVAALRDLVAEEREACTTISEIDAKAQSRIPVLFAEAHDHLRAFMPSNTCDLFIRRIAIDMIASTNELELT